MADPMNSLLVLSYATAVLIDVIAPVVLAVFLIFRFKARWRYWFYGMLVFLVFQVATRIPVMLAIQSVPAVQRALQRDHVFWVFALTAALTAGLFEEGGRWLAFRFIVPSEERRWRTAMILGAGHGGLESIGIGALQLGALIGYVALCRASPDTLSVVGSQVEEARRQYAQLTGWEPLLGGWERVCALTLQMAFTLMVLRAFTHGARWWWAACAAHTAVDFVAIASMKAMGRIWQGSIGMLAVEGIVTITALLGLWFILRAKREDEKRQHTGD